MKMVCVSRSADVATGLRLAGIETYALEKEEDIIKKIEELFSDDGIGILGVTEDIYGLFSKEIDELSQKKEMPLIVTIPNTKLHKR